MAAATKTFITLICEKCGSKYQLTVDQKRRRDKKNVPGLCKSCMKERIHELRVNQINNMTPEAREAYINKQKEAWNRKSPEEKAKYSERTKEQLAKRTKEEWDIINKKNSEGLKRHWRTVSEEDKLKRVLPMIEATRDKFRKMTAEERSEYQKMVWSKMDPEKRAKRIENSRRRMIEYNLSIPDEEKINRVKCMQRWHANLTQKEKDELYRRIHQWYYDLTPEQRRDYNRKRLSASRKDNELCRKFEEMFNNSILSNYYYFGGKEYSTMNNDGSHPWDYAIYSFKDDSLQMLVDIDGKYYHGDQEDYDGIHSTEEYDEQRYLTIPHNTKSFIINELQLKKSFELMMRELMVNYDEYIKLIFDHCRMMPFPYPHYTDNELNTSMRNLCRMNCDDNYHKNISLGTKMGYRIIQHFHPSIYHAHVKNKLSPYDAWYDDELLMKCVQNRVIYQSYLNPNKILQGFNISKIATKVSVFSSGRAKLIINKYLKEYNEIFDPFSGFSGRMLGAISLNKRYIGQDINEIHVKESNDIIERFGLSCKVYQSDIMNSYGEYESLFTCPPYGNKEIWINHEKDVYKSCDEWIDISLSHFKCKRYVFVVDQTEKYQKHIEYVIRNKSHFGYNEEYIIVIDR